MRNFKSILYFAIFGFLISFVFGLFSHSSFLVIFVKAIIFLLVFALLGFVISFVFSKFLDDDSTNELSGEDGTNSSVQENNTKGKIVDLVIQDEELAPKQSENSFFVGSNRQMLNESDYSPNNQTTKNENENSGFVPLRDFKSPQNISSVEAISGASTNNVSNSSDGNISSATTNETNSDELDVLPEMSSFAAMDENVSHSNNDENDTDNGFEPSYTSSNRKSDSFVGDMPDTGLIAKAISSVLSQESS